MTGAAVEASVVVPTYGEAENIPHLARAVDSALRAAGVSYELIVADDPSGDDTAAVCAELSESLPLRLLSRTGPRGLSAAVVDGISLAAGEFVVVMDADMSHPPERIPEMLDVLRSGRADFVVGSRYVSGGGTAADWGFFRWLNSKAATWMAAPLAPLADPMSGFFALRRALVPAAEALSPIGYKIGLEILVKAGFGRARVAETPIYFRDRERGESKMTLREQVNYLRHLRRLYHHRWPKRMEAAQFCAVGGVGLLWDLLFYYGLQLLGLGHLTARALAFWPAVTSNWFLNRVMTFKTRERDFAARQWMKFAVVSALGFAINWGAYAALTSGLDWFDRHRLLALLLGVLAGTAWNFVVSDLFVYRRKR